MYPGFGQNASFPRVSNDQCILEIKIGFTRCLREFLMTIHSAYLKIEPGQPMAAVFKALREYDPTLELGPTIQAIKCGEQVVALEPVGGLEGLQRFVSLVNELSQQEIQAAISISNVPPHADRDRQFVRLATLAELTEEIRELAAVAASQAEFRAWRESQDVKDGHVVIVEREASFEETIERIIRRESGCSLAELHEEELSYQYLREFELRLIWGGFRAYFCSACANGADEVSRALIEVGSQAGLKVMNEALRVFDTVGGYSAVLGVRLDRVEQLPSKAFDSCNASFAVDDEDFVALAIARIETMYESEFE